MPIKKTPIILAFLAMLCRYSRCKLQIIQLGFKEHPMQYANVCQLLNHDFDYALILSGDQLYQMDFNEMIEEHIKHGYHNCHLTS
jgi:ADP-glucose pyrophosphorylase